MGPGLLGWELCSGEKRTKIGLTKVGKGTKRMLVADGNGIPLALLVAGANRAEVELAEMTLERVQVPRRRGRPRSRPERLVADKGYDSDDLRRWLRSKGVIPCIPRGGIRRGGARFGGRNTVSVGMWSGHLPGWRTSVGW